MEHTWRPEPLGEGGRPGPLRPAAGQEQDPHGIHGMGGRRPHLVMLTSSKKKKKVWLMITDAKLIYF